MRSVVVLFLVGVLALAPIGVGVSKDYVPLIKRSVIYNPRTRKDPSQTHWHYLPCLHCHGKGFRVVVVHKGNTSVRLLKVCPWCGGSGHRGLSKR